MGEHSAADCAFPSKGSETKYPRDNTPFRVGVYRNELRKLDYLFADEHDEYIIKTMMNKKERYLWKTCLFHVTYNPKISESIPFWATLASLPANIIQDFPIFKDRQNKIQLVSDSYLRSTMDSRGRGSLLVDDKNGLPAFSEIQKSAHYKLLHRYFTDIADSLQCGQKEFTYVDSFDTDAEHVCDILRDADIKDCKFQSIK